MKRMTRPQPRRRFLRPRQALFAIMPSERRHRSQGFSLVEVMITVAIIAILSAVAVPNYFNSLNKAKQSEAATQISQIQSGIQAYNDEFLTPPSGWTELGQVTTVMTASGVATGTGFSTIQAQSGNYSIAITKNGATYTITATTSQAGVNWNILACVDTSTGASQLTRGNGAQSAATPVCS